jgi:hypothetical protein
MAVSYIAGTPGLVTLAPISARELFEVSAQNLTGGILWLAVLNQIAPAANGDVGIYSYMVLNGGTIAIAPASGPSPQLRRLAPSNSIVLAWSTTAGPITLPGAVGDSIFYMALRL